MNCEGCGADVPEGSKWCPACGHELGMGPKATAGSHHVAEKTGEVAGKVGREATKVGKGIWGGAKAVGAGAKKGFKGSDDEKKGEEK